MEGRLCGANLWNGTVRITIILSACFFPLCPPPLASSPPLPFLIFSPPSHISPSSPQIPRYSFVPPTLVCLSISVLPPHFILLQQTLFLPSVLSPFILFLPLHLFPSPSRQLSPSLLSILPSASLVSFPNPSLLLSHTSHLFSINNASLLHLFQTYPLLPLPYLSSLLQFFPNTPSPSILKPS